MLQNSGYRGNQNYLVFVKIVYLYYMLLNWRKFEGSVAEKIRFKPSLLINGLLIKKKFARFFQEYTIQISLQNELSVFFKCLLINFLLKN